MDSKPKDFKLSPSVRSNHGKPAPRKMKSLTLFEDLLDSHEQDCSASHHQNEASAVNGNKSSWLSNGFTRMSDDNAVYQRIEQILASSLSCCGSHVRVEAIYRNGHSTALGRAKFQSFGVYSMAVKERCGGNATVKCAWYGASRNEIDGILSYGFGLPSNNIVSGHGFCFSTTHHPLESLQSSPADVDGVRHMLLCRVILGKVEVIPPGSGQHNPSSEEYDSAVDELVRPRKFVMWNSKVNTHVLPEFVVSFRTS